MTSEQEVSSPRTIYECDVCDKTFPACAKLRNHERVHTGEKPYVCLICHQGFKQSAHLKRHQKVHTNQRPYVCEFCDRSFKHKAHLKRHNVSHHSSNIVETSNYQSPDQLDETNGVEVSAINKQINGHQDELYQCHVCGKMFKRWKNLLRHESKHTENHIFEYEKAFLGSQEISEHNGNQVEQRSTEHSLKKHEGSSSKEKPWLCEFCGKRFHSTRDLVIHRKTHSDERPNQCDICDKAYKQKSHLNRHKKMAHSEEHVNIVSTIWREGNRHRKLQRSACKENLEDLTIYGDNVDHDVTHGEDDSAYFKTDQTRGEEIPSLLQKQNSCKICGKSFTTRSYLAVHQRIHTGEMPFECNICGKHFRQRAHVAKHKKAVHSSKIFSKAENISNQSIQSNGLIGVPNEYKRKRAAVVKMDNFVRNKKFKCINDHCTFEPLSDASLILEEGENSSEELNKAPTRKLSQCNICHKKFKQKSYLNVHMRIHTGKLPFSCNICNKAFRQHSHVIKHRRTIHNVSHEPHEGVKQSKDFENETETRVEERQEEYMEQTTAGETFASEYSMVSYQEIFEKYRTASRNDFDSPEYDSLNSNDGSLSDKLSRTSEFEELQSFQLDHSSDVLTAESGENVARVADHIPDDIVHAKLNRHHTFATVADESVDSEEKNKYGTNRKISIGKAFHCEICRKKFSQKSDLNVHMRIHTGALPFRCEICSKAFRQKSHLVRHRRAIHKILKSFSQCHNSETGVLMDETQKEYKEKTTPGETFASDSSMVHDQEMFKISTSTNGSHSPQYDSLSCNKSSLADLQLNTSKDEEASRLKCEQNIPIEPSKQTDKSLACDICGKAFKRKHHLVVHTRTHTGEKPFGCLICGRRFTQDCHLNVHMAKVHPDEFSIFRFSDKTRKEATYKCTLCDKVYKRMHFLKQHEKTHYIEAVNESPAPLPHLPSEDSTVHPFKCRFSPKILRWKHHLTSPTSHERVHTGIRPYECDVCGQAYRQSSHLVRHKKSHEVIEPVDVVQNYELPPNDVKPYQCDMCCRSFKSKKGLSYHASRCGSTLKEFEATKEPSHSPTRVKKLAYGCKECGKRFDRKQTLQIHQRIHSGAKPYECDECGKGFTIAGNLQRHKIIHTGLTPYICNICGKGCTQKSNLECHVRLVHKVNKEEACKERRSFRSIKLTHPRRSNTAFKHEVEETSQKPIFGIVESKKLSDKRTHNDEIYRCLECGKKFDLATSMLQHCVESH